MILRGNHYHHRHHVFPLMIYIFSTLISIYSSSSSSSQVVTRMSIQSNNVLSFTRVNINSDVHKHISIKMYGYSKEAVTMHTMILFRSPINQIMASLYGGMNEKYIHNNTLNHYHNILLINSQFYQNYYKIMRDSNFEYNNEIPLVSLHKKFLLSYSVISNRNHWDRLIKYTRTNPLYGSSSLTTDTIPLMGMGSSGSIMPSISTSNIMAPTYHSILSLDHTSSIWDHFNTFSIDRNFVSFKFNTNGRLDDTLGDYTSMTKLKCNQKHHNPLSIDNKCIITSINQIAIGS